MGAGMTSMERALSSLKQAQKDIANAVEELGQLNRCPDIDYPSGAPPLKRCVLETGHEGVHLYPEKHFMDGGEVWFDPGE